MIINDVSVFEEGTNAQFTVTLSSNSTNTITVDYATSQDTATSGVDFTATKGTLTFAPGETTKTFSIPIITDSNIENNETVILNLQNPTNVTLTDASGTLTIVDNDLNLTSGTESFSGKSFSNNGSFVLATGTNVRQTLTFDATTSLGSSKLVNFTVGSGITTDIFDYSSTLISGNNTITGNLPSPSGDFALTNVNSGALAANIISANATGVLDFETSALNLDFTGAVVSLTDITNAAEALLESTSSSSNLTGVTAQVTQGVANADSLLIFYESSNQGATSDAVIIRYQEGSSPEADFSGELSVLAIFEGISSSDTFNDANII